MRERKKIRYVEKQPPDKSNPQDAPQTTHSHPQPEEKKYEHHTHHQRNRNQQQQTYLVQEQKPRQSKNNHQGDYKPRYTAKEQKNSGNYYEKKQEPRPRDQKRNYNNPKDQHLAPPRFVERQSSHHDLNCIICSEEIRRKDWIWTCTCCYISMHLKCIKEWIKNINQQQLKQSLHIFNWKCPQCNFEYNQPMPKYYCFCGKHLNPEVDRDLLPHSCGQICDRKRGATCTHPCPKTCHPGKCQPCDHEGSMVSCQCGKSQRMVKCSQDRLVYQCGKKCEKILNCHKHKCERNCHPGACQPCKKKKMSSCYCGQNSDIIDCIDSSYSCGQVCGKKLACGFHNCEMKCHLGQCNNCPHTPELQTTCPCGKYSIQMLTGDPDFRQSCEDPIPVCGMPCSRKLDCGHVCPNSCHEGPCKPCKVVTDQSCTCGHQSRKIECSQKQHNPFKCELVCKKKRSCGNHLCNDSCCPQRNSPVPADHPCDLNCTKMLNCGKHDCGEPCHIGLCKKCPVIYSQPQPCPCGRTFLRPPIICGSVVPQCDNPCDKELACGHKCKNICHYGPCKCVEDALVTCRCGKEQIPTICGREALCLTKCPQTLKCGHKCGLQCHKGTCEQAHKITPCRKSCNRERSDCKHLCAQLCHPDQQCEDFPCQAQILVKCECGHRQAMTLCGAHQKHKTKKTIVCNKKCENLKRFDMFYRDKEIYYPGNMVQFAFRNYPFLQNLEAKLQKFILHTEQNFIEIQYKFQDNFTKLLLTDLFENHYHLNTHFYSRMKHSAFTLMQGDDTMIPKPVLSEYIKLISSGKIKQNNLPFEFTISFEMEQKDKGSLIIKSLKDFVHKFYSQRTSRHISLHFWSREVGQAALLQLEEQFQTVDFKCSINLTKPEEQVTQEEIMEVQEEVKEEEPKKEKEQVKVEQTQVKQKEEKKQGKIEQAKPQQKAEEKKEDKKQLFIPEPPSQVKKILSNDQKPKLIVRKNIPSFRKNDYPPSKENVQDIYLIDEEELFDEKIDWDKFITTLCEKKMGPEATEWRIRCLLMINTFHEVKENFFHELFNSLIKMYNKDKEATLRILDIQRIDNKSVKSEMESNGIYLSHHEPEMLSYLRFYNYLAEQKIEIDFPEIIHDTPEFQKAQDILEAIHKKNPKDFYEIFKTCDYVYSCALIPLIHALRDTVLESIGHGGRFAAKDMYKYLLFTSQAQLEEYFKSNGLEVGTRVSKSAKEDIFMIKSGEVSKQRVEDKRFIKEFITEKRDKRYFLQEPQELYQERLATLSFFAFGDFKESIIQSYMNSLVKVLKQKE